MALWIIHLFLNFIHLPASFVQLLISFQIIYYLNSFHEPLPFCPRFIWKVFLTVYAPCPFWVIHSFFIPLFFKSSLSSSLASLHNRSSPLPINIDPTLAECMTNGTGQWNKSGENFNWDGCCLRGGWEGCYALEANRSTVDNYFLWQSILYTALWVSQILIDIILD